jgi:hypothetical protein
MIATLPEGIKDPGEFTEKIGKGKTSSEIERRFRSDVLETAKEWSAWYVNRILSRYDARAPRGTPESFGAICERISDFLSSFSNPAERTKRAHDVASSLAVLVEGGSDSGNGSASLKIQLESDLVDMVARKAAAKESVGRRLEAVDGFSGKLKTEKLSRMSKGEGYGSRDGSTEMIFPAAEASIIGAGRRHTSRALRSQRQIVPSSKSHATKPRSRRGDRRRMKRLSVNECESLPLTPHFNGFDFANPTDAAWLGLPREKVREFCLAPLLVLAMLTHCRFRHFSGEGSRAT